MVSAYCQCLKFIKQTLTQKLLRYVFWSEVAGIFIEPVETAIQQPHRCRQFHTHAKEYETSAELLID